METKLEGVFCALWTPVDSRGDVQVDSLRAILRFVLESGVHGIMALGSTAEFPRMTVAQRKQVLEEIASGAGGRPIIANISDVRFHTAVELGIHAREHGARCISLLPPWFYSMDQRELAEFFIRVAEQVQLPLALYNYPEVAGKRIELATIRQVAAAVPVIAVKQSGGEFAYHKPLAEVARELGIALLTGADTQLPQAMQIGASGTVSGLSNAVADLVARTYAAVKAGNTNPSEATLLTRLDEAMQELPFPLNVRAAIAARGLPTGELKSPISSEARTKYDSLVDRIRSIYQTANLPPAP